MKKVALFNSEANNKEDTFATKNNSSKSTSVYTDESLDLLLKRLSGKENDVLINETLYKIGKFKTQKAINALAKYAKSNNFESRWVVAEALGEIGLLNAVDVLVDCLNTESNQNVKIAIIQALSRYNCELAIKTLLLCWINGDKNYERQEAFIGLEGLGVTLSFDKLVKYSLLLYSSSYKTNNPKILVDASLISDYLFSEDKQAIVSNYARRTIDLVLDGSIEGYITEIGLEHIWTIAKKLKSREYACYLIVKTLNCFHLCQIEKKIIEKAKTYSLNSIETGIQVECAKSNMLDAIVTLRAKDFLGCGFTAFPPSLFLNYYDNNKEEFIKNSCEAELYQEKLSSTLNLSHSQEAELILLEDWKIEHFDLLCSKNNISTASVVILGIKPKNKGHRYSESAFGVGAIETLFKALDRIVSKILKATKHYLISISVSNLEAGVEGSVSAKVTIEYDGESTPFISIHRNYAKACFTSYVKAINFIYDSTSRNKHQEEQINLYPITDSLANKIIYECRNDKRNLSNITLTEANLESLNLSASILNRSNLSFSNLKKVNLSEALLCEAKLVKANLSKAILCKTNFSSANLTEANLSGAILSYANLSGANLTKANLSDTDLTKSNLADTILVDTIMPEFRLEIFGTERIERLIQLFDQFNSNHYEICAVHSNTYGAWWNDEVGNKFKKINKKLSEKGISVKRVFIIPKNNFDSKTKAIIEEQVNLGIEVRCLSEEYAADFDGFNLKKTNFLVCKNTLVKKNSFTTMMLFDEKKQKESNGYISFDKDDLQINEQRFNMIWGKAETYLKLKKKLTTSNNFEMMYILRPDLSEDQVEESVTKYQNFLAERGAENIETQIRGKRRLAYPVGKYLDGIYVQVNYEADGSQIAPLERMMRLSEDAIRYLTIKSKKATVKSAQSTLIQEYDDCFHS